jgi:hypothetical protein
MLEKNNLTTTEEAPLNWIQNAEYQYKTSL